MIASKCLHRFRNVCLLSRALNSGGGSNHLYINSTINNMAKHFGIEWAPLKTPVKRRRQTFAIWLILTLFILSYVVSFILCLFLLYIHSLTRVLVFLYLGWAFVIDRGTPSKGGRTFPFLRRLSFLKHYVEFFPLNLIKTHDLDPSKNYIFGCHPHGVIAFGAQGNFATEATGFSKLFPGVIPHLLTLEIQFKIPFFREIIMALGICSVSKESFHHILTDMGAGHSCVVVVGGAAEALEARPGNFKLVLKNRKGFVNMALKTGASLVPVFSFGENNLYKQYPNPEGSYLRKVQTKVMEIATFSPPLFHGRGIFQYTFGIIPFRKPVNTVVGKPIPTTLNADPSIEELDQLHQQYLEGLREIFETFKSKFGIGEDEHLEFI